MYFAFIHSRLVYLSSIWSAAPKYLLDSIDILQRKALRIVFLKDSRCSADELYSEKILPVSLSADFHTLVMIYKMKYHLSQNNFEFEFVNQVHGYPTRSCSNIVVAHCNTTLGQNNFYVRGPNCFNNLPTTIKNIRSFPMFKSRLREHLFDLL